MRRRPGRALRSRPVVARAGLPRHPLEMSAPLASASPARRSVRAKVRHGRRTIGRAVQDTHPSARWVRSSRVTERQLLAHGAASVGVSGAGRPPGIRNSRAPGRAGAQGALVLGRQGLRAVEEILSGGGVVTLGPLEQRVEQRVHVSGRGSTWRCARRASAPGLRARVSRDLGQDSRAPSASPRSRSTRGERFGGPTCPARARGRAARTPHRRPRLKDPPRSRPGEALDEGAHLRLGQCADDESTTCASRNAKTAGIDWTRTWPRLLGFSSTFTLASSTAPPVSSTICSIIGPSVRQDHTRAPTGRRPPAPAGTAR